MTTRDRICCALCVISVACIAVMAVRPDLVYRIVWGI